MKYFDWDEDKNKWLIANRGISFEMIIEYVTNEEVVIILNNHPPYEHQRVYMINIDNYMYEIPIVEDDQKIFLNTIYPSSKATKKYLNDK